MNQEQIGKIVKSAFSEYVAASTEEKMEISDNTALVGDGAALDSVGLVNVLLDIESQLTGEGCPVTLMSEKAMSAKNSPFRSVKTLVEFIGREAIDE